MIKRGLNKTLAEVGKIKTGYRGEKRQAASGREYGLPKKLDHFIVTTLVRGEDGNYVQNEAIMKILGPGPKEVKIRLLFDDIDKNFFTQYQAYEGGHKLCAGDGEKAERKGELKITGGEGREKIAQTGTDPHEVPCDPETCPIAQAGRCKVTGILNCFLPQSGDLGGVYKFRTHSWHAVSSILAALEFFAAQTDNILQGIPLKLVLLPKTTEDHGKIYYATLMLDGEEFHGLRRLAIEEREDRKLLGVDMRKVEETAAASGILGDTDDEEEIAAEYFVGEDEEARPAKGTSAESLEAQLAEKAGAQGNQHAGAETTGTSGPIQGPRTTGASEGELGLEGGAAAKPPQSAPVANARGPAGAPPQGKAAAKPAAAPKPGTAAAQPKPAAAPAPKSAAPAAPKPAPAPRASNIEEDTIF